MKKKLIVLIVMFIGAFVQAGLNDGLVAYYPFNGNANDQSGNSYDGTVYGGASLTQDRFGNSNNAYSFNGTDGYIGVESYNGISGTNARTVSAWFKTSAGSFQTIAQWGEDTIGNLWLVSIDKWGKMAVAAYGGGVYSNTEVKDGQWHLVTAVLEQGETSSENIKLYIDGQFSSAPYDNGQCTINTSTSSIIRIGAWGNVNGLVRFFDGSIDDVRIYDRALSAEEIENLYRGELTGLEIMGPEQAAESSQAQYRAIAHYDNESTQDVTDLANWSVDPNNVASITGGLLTTERINLPTDVTMTAQYSQGDVDAAAQKDVSVLTICPSGSALEFDGVDDYVDCGNNSSLDMTDEITISTWVKRSHYNTADAIAGKNNGNSVTAGYGIFSYTQGFEFNLYSEGKWRRTTPRVPASPNQWHHITGTYDGENLNLYVDGERKASLGYVGTMTPAVGHPLNIAHWRSALPAHFDGLIDEVAIYNRALSAEEIWALMHRKPDMDDPSLVGYWNLDEGVGQAAYDSSAYANDGTLGSTPDIDNSDPVWVGSDAPVGICTLEGIVERNLSDIRNKKLSILEQLYEAMIQEEALLNYMDEKFASRDFGDTSKGDVVKAKQKVMGAIQAEGQAGAAVDQSIDKIDDALNTLGIGLDADRESVE